MKTHPCYQCGFCCKISACGYGKWDAANHRCSFLNTNGSCSKYAEIIEHEKNVRFPMMGCGCSSILFNDMRDAKMRELGVDLQVEEDEELGPIDDSILKLLFPG